MRVYLAGPINGKSDAAAKEWREWIKDRVDWEILDPMRRDYRGKEMQNVRAIVMGDYRDIQKCDVFFAYCEEPSVGTSMELYIASQKNKFCVVVFPYEDSSCGCPGESPCKKDPSPWLVFCADEVVRSLQDGVDAVERFIDNARPQRLKPGTTHGVCRWCGGTGVVPASEKHPNDHMKKNCPSCGGKGVESGA